MHECPKCGSKDYKVVAYNRNGYFVQCQADDCFECWDIKKRLLPKELKKMEEQKDA